MKRYDSWVCGEVRAIRDDEVEQWCACPYGTQNWVDSEREWFRRWHAGAGNLFFYRDAGGGLPGKYDVPIERPGRWALWAPTVREGARAAAVMDALCAHVADESGRRGVAIVELTLESGHRCFDLAREGLGRAGFVLAERRVVFQRDLNEALPETPDLEVAEVSERDPAELAELRRRVGMLEKDEQTTPSGLIALRGEEPIGLALYASGPGQSPFTLDHFGVVAEARRTGYGKALLVRTLQAAREGGSTCYVGSTRESNEPMRRLFASVGCRELGTRLIFSLSHPKRS